MIALLFFDGMDAYFAHKADKMGSQPNIKCISRQVMV